MKKRHRICFRRMMRRLDNWMTENGKTWEDVVHLFEEEGLKPESARRKVKRLQNLEGKPCSCVLMDIITKMNVPPEIILLNNPF